MCPAPFFFLADTTKHTLCPVLCAAGQVTFFFFFFFFLDFLSFLSSLPLHALQCRSPNHDQIKCITVHRLRNWGGTSILDTVPMHLQDLNIQISDSAVLGVSTSESGSQCRGNFSAAEDPTNNYGIWRLIAIANTLTVLPLFSGPFLSFAKTLQTILTYLDISWHKKLGAFSPNGKFETHMFQAVPNAQNPARSNGQVALLILLLLFGLFRTLSLLPLCSPWLWSRKARSFPGIKGYEVWLSPTGCAAIA